MNNVKRCAVVTGAAQGIGLAVARRLAADGVRVLGVDVNGTQLEDAMDGIPDAAGITGDLRSDAVCGRVVEEAVARLGRIDILVSAAGGVPNPEPGVGDPALRRWREVVATNLDTALYMSMHVGPLMQEAGWGRVIFIGSGAGRVHSRTRSIPYATAKAGVHGLMRQMAVIMAPHGVACNVVSPGLMLTPRVQAEWDALDEAGRRNLEMAVPAGRLGQPEEIASMVSYLASDEAGYVIGQTICVDGGTWMI